MRLDKFLCDMGFGTRNQIKKEIRAGLVMVNDQPCKKAEEQIDETKDKVVYQGKPCVYEAYVYYMLHKPAGVITATSDSRQKTVLDLMGEAARPDLFPVGRLDKDTEGLLLITNDGALSHNLLSPAKHVPKTYECHLAEHLTDEQKAALEQGVDIGEKKPAKPATVEVLADSKILLTITEGKFHQVKRMLHAVGNEVVYLKRLQMGSLVLDQSLAKGGYRKLTDEEIMKLYDESGNI